MTPCHSTIVTPTRLSTSSAAATLKNSTAIGSLATYTSTGRTSSAARTKPCGASSPATVVEPLVEQLADTVAPDQLRTVGWPDDGPRPANAIDVDDMDAMQSWAMECVSLKVTLVHDNSDAVAPEGMRVVWPPDFLRTDDCRVNWILKTAGNRVPAEGDHLGHFSAFSAGRRAFTSRTGC